MLKSITTRICLCLALVGLLVFGSFAAAENNGFAQDQVTEQQTIAVLSKWVSDSTKSTVSVSESTGLS